MSTPVEAVDERLRRATRRIGRKIGARVPVPFKRSLVRLLASVILARDHRRSVMDNLVIGGQRGVERILVAFRGGVLQSGQNAADVARPRCAEERYGSAGYRVLRNAAGIFEAAGLGDGGTGSRCALQVGRLGAGFGSGESDRKDDEPGEPPPEQRQLPHCDFPPRKRLPTPRDSSPATPSLRRCPQ